MFESIVCIIALVVYSVIVLKILQCSCSLSFLFRLKLSVFWDRYSQTNDITRMKIQYFVITLLKLKSNFTKTLIVLILFNLISFHLSEGVVDWAVLY